MYRGVLMKKIIDGKIYNTDTAELIGEYSFSNRTDFRYVEERLYRTKKGAYFLHGEGGALSPYAIQLSNGSTGGETIILMSLDAARNWAMEKLDSETYLMFFEAEEA